MSETPRHLSFEKIDHSTDRGTQEIQGFFQDADSVPAKMVKNYAKEIADRINTAQSPDEQKIFLIDLLREDALEKIIQTKGKAEGFSQEDLEDVKKMTKSSVKQIRQAVAEELKKYLPEDLYFFIKKYVSPELESHNQRLSIENTRGELFLKTNDRYSHDISDNLKIGLEMLKTAMDGLDDPDKEMPFIPHLLITNRPKNLDRQVAFGVAPKNILTIQEIFEDKGNNFSDREKIQAVVDCVKGAKFLADNGLTLTDLDTKDPGRNIGIDIDTKKGILFDLDGLMPANTQISAMLAAMDQGKPMKELIAPEYQGLSTGQNIISRKESMIWELGDTIYRLAKNQEDELYKSPNFFSQQNLVSMWEKLREFSEKMRAQKPEDRPSFDVCITKLEGIINKYLPENK